MLGSYWIIQETLNRNIRSVDLTNNMEYKNIKKLLKNSMAKHKKKF